MPFTPQFTIPYFHQKNRLLLSCIILFLSCNGQKPYTPPYEPHIQKGSTTDPAAPAPSGNSQSLRVMSYNVLKYGDECQDKNEHLHKELQTIIRYANPDILGMVKVAAPQGLGNDTKAHASAGFPKEILANAMNAAFAGRYDVCPSTNAAGANNINLLFYDKAKLGYADMQTVLSSETDFNLYRLYLRSSIAGKDTTFLYILQNHTESGDDAGARNTQMSAIMQKLHSIFKSLPNVIDMGDFNLRKTSETGYQSLVSGTGDFHFSDPPFSLDKSLQYPADWEKDPEPFAKFLTTSTRKREGEPNDCGTGGGAKFWFDHILLSPPVAAGSGGISYVPGSYHTIGNDGSRTGRSVNADKHPNAAVAPEVADALFYFSNKYPVMLELKY